MRSTLLLTALLLALPYKVSYAASPITHALFAAVSAFELAALSLSAYGVSYGTCKKPRCDDAERTICCSLDTIASDGHRILGRCQEFDPEVFTGYCKDSLPTCENGFDWYCQLGTGSASPYSNMTFRAKEYTDSNIPGGYTNYQASLAGVIISPIAFVATLIAYSCMVCFR